MALRKTDGSTEYSKTIGGEEDNYKWPVRFDITGTTVGISQTHDGDSAIERVLLSRAQVKALMEFVSR